MHGKISRLCSNTAVMVTVRAGGRIILSAIYESFCIKVSIIHDAALFPNNFHASSSWYSGHP